MRFTSFIVIGLTLLAPLFAQSRKEIITTGQVAGLPFSAAVKAGGLIYASGAIGVGESGAAAGDVRAQTTRTLDAIAGTLKAAGSSMPMVANLTVYLPNIGEFAAMNE